jgi:hypothetical protein
MFKWFKKSSIHKDEKGGVNIGGTLLLGLAMVFLAVGFIMLPIATNATDSILAYVYTGNNTITDASFTGLTPVVGITPLLILIGFLVEAVIAGMLGVKVMKSGGGGSGVNIGGLLLSGLSIVFIAVGLIMFPVALDGISSVYDNGGIGISSTYTGFEAILLIAPMLVLLSFVAASVITGFFGIKSIAKAA